MNVNVCLCLLSYLDPGAGSLLMQALVGGAAGLLVAFRHFWKIVRPEQRTDSAGRD
ncbi:MAG: hypothetical protein ACOVRM_13670 [Planctomycetaceae bacterium]|jgi:hypothetical protein